MEESERKRKQAIEDKRAAKKSTTAAKMQAISSGQADTESALIQQPTNQGFVWRNYEEGKDAVTQQGMMMNNAALMGYNEYSFRNRFIGMGQWLDLLEKYDEDGASDFRNFMEEESISLEEDPTLMDFAKAFGGTAAGFISTTQSKLRTWDKDKINPGHRFHSFYRGR